MTTQREPDTSAEGLMGDEVTLLQATPGLFLFEREGRRTIGLKTEYRTPEGLVEAYVAETGEFFWGGASTSTARDALIVCEINHDALFRTLADAAGQAAPVPPPVETEDSDFVALMSHLVNYINNERVSAYNEGVDAARASEHDRAEGLAKEVERLKAQAREDAALIGRLNGGAELQAVMKINNDLVAKLAVYEAPIGDGEVEKLAGASETYAEGVEAFAARTKTDDAGWTKGLALHLRDDAVMLRRLSAAHAECKGENTKLREALEFYADPLAHGADGTPDFYDEMDFGERARAALAPASEEWTPTHRHANGGLYRLLPVEFHWEPEWDKKAVLYENEKGVKIGRFADVFAARFTPLAPASEEKAT